MYTYTYIHTHTHTHIYIYIYNNHLKILNAPPPSGGGTARPSCGMLPRPRKPAFQSLLSAALRRHFSTSVKPSSTATTSSGGVALYLRRARLIDSLRRRLRSSTIPDFSSSLDSFVAVHALRAAPSPDSALLLFRSLPSPHHPLLLRSLATRLALSGRLPDLLPLLPDLHPSPIDLLRWFSAAGDTTSALTAWSSLRSTAVSRRHHPCTESYNLIMALHVSTASHSDAIAVFSQMISDGANPNSRTYTIIIDHLIKAGYLDPGMEIFTLLPSMRIRRTSRQYDVLASAFSSSNRFDDLRKLLAEMEIDGILPGRGVRAAIIAMRATGHTAGTENYIQEITPDERIQYIVDSGDEEEENDGNDRMDLKPWMDPGALASALEGWDAENVRALEEARFVWTTRLVCKLLRAFKKPETAWAFFSWVACQPGGFAHDKHTVSRMIAILAKHGHCELVDRLLTKVQSEGILLPFATIRLIIDFYGLSKKPDAAMKVHREASKLCGPISHANCLLLCSSMLRTLLKSRKGDSAMDFLEDMMMNGMIPDLQTFSGLMEFFAGDGDLKRVHRVFGMVRECGMVPDAFMLQVVMRAYCKKERAALALRVFDEMRSLGLVPDRVAKELLVKSLWKEGKLREAAQVEEKCEDLAQELPMATPGHVWTQIPGLIVVPPLYPHTI
ncbi:pentatricopeptide repeat-containing protein At5g66631 isoform X2 [Dioscorea cayenensis subsp. rotundata]|uniref:Pentatricopeptide repeat-containing protein At5g66631 isoform X2 n=1 Tax=Dioscorea cayennensis subsp. rotundata TaxID=55577 RepID=A0AB40C5K3_DIOCR|nr:pentatricopeptide repeat-containing protein At5g66631 isoform X2 [Dioscorea cayenensis subsp. rotundata]